MSLFWRGQGLFDWKYRCVKLVDFPSPSAYFWKVLALPVAMKVLTARDVVTYEMSKWMQKLYGCTVQVGAGEKRCLVKEGVEI